jgi:hypothetical protein
MSIAARAIVEDANVFWIFQDEIKAINERRRALNKKREERGEPVRPELADGSEHAREVIEAVGLALSGGGMRSAAVCLGALQALNHNDALRNVDYLSTVSGGGYIGCSLTATMTKSGGEFVFGTEPSNPASKPLTREISDTEAVGHLRNYSNYLMPDGFRDVVTAAAIVVRGLIANLGLILPMLLLLAMLTIWANPDRSALLRPEVFGISVERYVPTRHFGVTLALTLLALVLFLHGRSTGLLPLMAQFRTKLPSWGAGIVVLIAITFFLELQPFVVAGMFDMADVKAGVSSGVLLGLITSWIQTLAGIAAPIAAAVTVFRQQFGELLKAVSGASGWLTQLAAIAAKAAVWIAGCALPLLIWVTYLYLCYWGIINNTPTDPIGPGTHTPAWLLTAANEVSSMIVGRVIDRPMALLYLSSGLLLFLLSWILTPNANSLHRLYRDRLSKAFLFDPTSRLAERPTPNQASIDQGRDFGALDAMRLSDLSESSAPYHLINATLNIQGSDYANRRGRNADFFLISKYWIGSQATGYAPMEEFEPAAGNLDLATAMAISGAAVSSNMGVYSVRPLTPTLAILNIRLGYWMKNPAFWAPTGAVSIAQSHRGAWIPKHRSTLFLWSEITGRLYENADEVYLTDGGHIENLGIYELLRRRCRFIVGIDVEPDATMHFPSFVRLERYARIDLGIRITLPWEAIQKTTLALMSSAAGTAEASSPNPQPGPHVAIGTIDYGGGEIGYLMYVKTSLTGDENDYIRDYARRYSRFPHESTGDQFFSEEQFEVYRALGFHMMHGVLSGSDHIEVVGALPGVVVKFADVSIEPVRRFRTALMS